MNEPSRKWNLGDALHLLEIAALLLSMGMTYQKFAEASAQVSIHTRQLDRIEHYLSSKDPSYWKASREDQ